MFSADNIYVGPKWDDIMEVIDEIDIFKRYCSHFQEIHKPFLSDLYKDTKPDCRIFIDTRNRPMYKDFGFTDHYFDCIGYMQAKFSISYTECLKMIARDFSIYPIGNIFANTEFKPRSVLPKTIEVNLAPKIKPVIYITGRNWLGYDVEFWTSYYLTLNDVREDTIPCQYAYLTIGDKTITFTNSRSNPIYAYKEYDHETGEFLGYKLYMPKSTDKDRRFVACNNISRSIPGLDIIPETGDLLIITKSRKDLKCLNKLGYDAISCQGENMNLSEDLINTLKLRFKEVILLYDNDTDGIKAATKMTTKYDIRSIIIPAEYDSKDVSDLMKNRGFTEAKSIIKKLLNDATVVR